MHKKLQATLEQAQAKYKKAFDRDRAPAAEFQVGDLVWLNRRNMETTRLSQKLDFQRLGPFEIAEVVGESKVAFKLKLLPQWHIHPVFHASLLNPYQRNKIEGRRQLNPPPPEIVNGELQYEVETILDSKIQRNKLRYLVDWKEYGPEERTWETAENLENAKESINAFHRRHLNRPSASDLKSPKPRRSSVHRRGSTVMNDSPDNPEGTTRGPAGTRNNSKGQLQW